MSSQTDSLHTQIFEVKDEIYTLVIIVYYTHHHIPTSQSSINSTGGLAVCVNILFVSDCGPSSKSTSLSSSSVSNMTAGNAGLSPCTFGSYISVELRLRILLGDAGLGLLPASSFSACIAVDLAVFNLCSSSDVYCCCGDVGLASEVGGLSAILPVSFCSLLARSSACVSVLGGSSFFISQPTGGLGGGLMKNSLPASGLLRYFIP